MPHTHSAKKRLRQNAKRRTHNRAVLRAVKKQIKKLEDILAKGPADQLQVEFKATVKKLDKAAGRRVIHPNAAARKQSQLARRLRPKPPPRAGISFLPPALVLA